MVTKKLSLVKAVIGKNIYREDKRIRFQNSAEWQRRHEKLQTTKCLQNRIHRLYNIQKTNTVFQETTIHCNITWFRKTLKSQTKTVKRNASSLTIDSDCTFLFMPNNIKNNPVYVVGIIFVLPHVGLPTAQLLWVKAPHVPYELLWCQGSNQEIPYIHDLFPSGSADLSLANK